MKLTPEQIQALVNNLNTLKNAVGTYTHVGFDDAYIFIGDSDLSCSNVITLSEALKIARDSIKSNKPHEEPAFSINGYDGKWYRRGSASGMVLMSHKPDGSGAYTIVSEGSVSPYVEEAALDVTVDHVTNAWFVLVNDEAVAVFYDTIPDAELCARKLAKHIEANS